VTERSHSTDVSEADGKGPADLPPRIRVAWVAGAHTFERRGRFLRPLAVGMMDESVDIELLCPEDAADVEVPSPPVAVTRYGRLRHFGMDTGAADALAGRLRSRKVQLLHALDAEATGLTHRLAHKADLPYLITSYELGDFRRLRRFAGQAVAIAAASTAARDQLLAHHTAPPERIRLLRPGVYAVPHATCFANPRHSVAIIAGGPLDDVTAFETVLRSFAELHSRKFDCVYFLFGSGRTERHLRRLAVRLELQHELTFVDWGVTSHLPDVFKAADLYISPAPCRCIDDGALSAIAAGVPVLAAAGGASDFLLDGQTALLFPRDNSPELTMKLTSLLDDRASARALAENALEYLRREHGAAGKVAALAEICRQAVTGAVPAAVAT